MIQDISGIIPADLRWLLLCALFHRRHAIIHQPMLLLSALCSLPSALCQHTDLGCQVVADHTAKNQIESSIIVDG